VQGTRYKVNALGKRLKAKGSRRKRGLDAIIRFKVQRRLQFVRRENVKVSLKDSKLKILNLKPYTFYLIPWTLESLAPQTLYSSRLKVIKIII
jgi:hypothetical protein